MKYLIMIKYRLTNLDNGNSIELHHSGSKIIPKSCDPDTHVSKYVDELIKELKTSENEDIEILEFSYTKQDTTLKSYEYRTIVEDKVTKKSQRLIGEVKLPESLNSAQVENSIKYHILSAKPDIEFKTAISFIEKRKRVLVVSYVAENYSSTVDIEVSYPISSFLDLIAFIEKESGRENVVITSVFDLTAFNDNFKGGLIND